jgi:hypothetical protein
MNKKILPNYLCSAELPSVKWGGTDYFMDCILTSNDKKFTAKYSPYLLIDKEGRPFEVDRDRSSGTSYEYYNCTTKRITTYSISEITVRGEDGSYRKMPYLVYTKKFETGDMYNIRKSFTTPNL